MFTLHDILDLAIRLEKNGETVYRNACYIVDSISLNRILVATAEEEAKHAQWFSSLKHNIQTDADHPIMKEINDALIDEFVGDQSFSLKEVDFTQIKTIKDMIDIFIEFENDTILFYDMLKSFINDTETVKSLDRIINEEKDHIEKFRELLPNGSR